MGRSLPLRNVAAVLLLFVTSCGYTPPPQSDTASAEYKADFAACDGSVPSDVAKRNAKKGLTWFASPVTRWTQIDDGMNACMEAKGWGRSRPCSDEERRLASANLAVTARGIQCSDPKKSVEPKPAKGGPSRPN